MLALVVLAEEIEEAVELAVREVLRAHALRPRVVPRPRALAVARGARRVDAAVGRPIERDRDRVARADAEVDVAKSFATIDVSTGGSGKVSNRSAAPISSGPKTRASEVALALRTFAPAGTLSSVLNGAGASSRGASVIVIANVEPSVHAPE